MYTSSSPLIRRQCNDATELARQLSTKLPVLLSAETSRLQNYRHWRNTYTFVTILRRALSLVLICCRYKSPIGKGNRIAGIERLQQRSGFVKSVWISTGRKLIKMKTWKFSSSVPCNCTSSLTGSSSRPCKEWAVDLSSAVIFAIWYLQESSANMLIYLHSLSSWRRNSHRIYQLATTDFAVSAAHISTLNVGLYAVERTTVATERSKKTLALQFWVPSLKKLSFV
jgi:hypothetical protein